MNLLERFTRHFATIVDRHVEYLICSSFVAISHERSRGTEDIEMIISRIDFNEFLKLHEDLVKEGFECIQSSNANEIYTYLIRNDSVRYVYSGSYLPEMEVKFVKDNLDLFQMNTRKKLPLSGLDLWFSSVEVNIAFKEELLKSDKDMEDAKHLRVIYSGSLDESLINKVKLMIREYRLK